MTGNSSQFHISVEHFCSDNDATTTTKAEFVSTVSERRTLGRRRTSQIIVCRPRHRSFFFFFFNDNAGEWMVARCRYLPSRIRSFDHTARRMECPSALPRRIRRCGTVHGARCTIAFHFVTCPPGSRTLKPGTFRRRSHSPLAERKDGCPSRVNRERSSMRSSHEAETAQEVHRSLTRPAMHVSAKCDDYY